VRGRWVVRTCVYVLVCVLCSHKKVPGIKHMVVERRTQNPAEEKNVEGVKFAVKV
jgi:hypothetical protein